jgi:hydroxymethylpyrimidine/phosphomethylpyrimidine kinase
MTIESNQLTCLSIAGFDPSGGAGIHADLKVFHSFGVYGAAATSLIAVQNSRGVSRVEQLPRDLIGDQIRAVVEDFQIHAVKLGALGTAGCILEVLDCLEGMSAPVICDPVISSSSGACLLETDAIKVLQESLIPRCYMLCPNLDEAAIISGIEVTSVSQMKEAAKIIADMGSQHVLITGGHMRQSSMDLLYSNASFTEFPHKPIETPHTHGTGCALSAAITACTAKGLPPMEAVETSKVFVQEAIKSAPKLGSEHGPINLLHRI